MKKIYSIPSIVAILAIMIFGQGQGDFLGLKVAFGYGGSSETVNLTTANEWAVISAPTKLTTFVSEDISTIMAYVGGEFVVVNDTNSDLLLEPVNAFYVLPSESSASITFTWNDPSSQETSSRDLSVGWNLVGTNNSGTAQNEFASIQNTAQKAGMLALFVPDTYNSRKNSGYISWGGGTGDLNANPITSLPGGNLSKYDGYWVNLASSAVYEKFLISSE